MWFQRGPYQQQNRLVRLFAGLALMGMGGVMLGFPLFGLPLLVVGFGIAACQGFHLWQIRGDRYDLKHLEKLHNALVEPEDLGEGELVYCHICGASMSADRAICPECGHYLGT